ncbi:hypothetical protein NBRC116494_16700 [Aurantivibrio plasticivorans]
MKLALIYLLFAFFTVYAWRDWYKSACALVFLMAFMKWPDIPRTMFGIPGLNLWNILLVNVVGAFILARKREGLVWDMPKAITFMLVVYFLLIYISTFRLMNNMGPLQEFYQFLGLSAPSGTDLIKDNIINSVRYLVPGFLIFYGCNSEQRLKLAVGAMLLLHMLLALQVIRWMPITDIANADALNDRGLRVLGNKVGYFKTDLAMILAGGSWMFVCSSMLFTKYRLFLLGGAAICLLGMALTGGRGGYIAWAVIGAIFALYRWRKLIFMAPFVVLAVFAFVPAVKDRLFEGVGGEANEQQQRRLEAVNMAGSEHDLYSISSGRLVVWPVVIGKIGEAPFWGYGRRGFVTSGAGLYVADDLNDPTFPHPHNAYLQFTIDNGLLGAIPVFLLFFLTAKRAVRMFGAKLNAAASAASGVGASTLFAFLTAAISAQYFYPVESSVPLWVGIALILRSAVELDKSESWLKPTGTQELSSKEKSLKIQWDD